MIRDLVSSVDMRFPSTTGSDYLLYHRLTGLGRSGTVEDVSRLIEKGFVLTPHAQRQSVDYDDEPAEMFGIDPIDVAAGDNEAVFFTPLQPVSAGLWGKSGFSDTPGVAFRLSDMLSCCDVSIRPQDFQTFYMNFISRSGVLQDALGCMQRSVDDVYHHADYLDMLEPSLSLLRSAEQWNQDIFPIVDSVFRSGKTLDIEPPRLYAKDMDEAVKRAVEYVSEFSYCDGVDPDEFWEDEQRVEIATQAIEASLTEQYDAAWDAWTHIRRERVEILVWGVVPLEKACVVFDRHKLLTRRC
jgi:hypothetical protein